MNNRKTLSRMKRNILTPACYNGGIAISFIIGSVGRARQETTGPPRRRRPERKKRSKERMIQKLIKMGAIVLTAAVLAACNSGSDSQGTGTSTGSQPAATEMNTGSQPAGTTGSGENAQPSGEEIVAAPTKTPETRPAKPQRLDHLLPTPTPKRDARKAAQPGTAVQPREPTTPPDATVTQTKAAPVVTQEPAEAQPTPDNIAALVPEDPQTNEQVLLQDIYRQIDLEQFALDPDEPVKFVELDNPNQSSLMEYPEVHDHPYLHLFPELQHIASQGNGNIFYIPGYESKNRGFDLTMSNNGLIYFIYNPWFEQVHNAEHRFVLYAHSNSTLGLQSADPYWFGDNSTRGILAETVAKLLEEAILPSAKPHPRNWWNYKETNRDGKVLTPKSYSPQEWTMEEYVRIGAGYPGRKDYRSISFSVDFHNVPQVQWEFLHPRLPILRITAHAEHTLPLLSTEQPTLLDEVPEEHRSDYERNYRYSSGKPEEEAKAAYLKYINDRIKREHAEKLDASTRYSISFVISLQNRWTSFDDPDRWVVRFGEDLSAYEAEPHFVDLGQGKNPEFVPDDQYNKIDIDYVPDHWNGYDTNLLKRSRSIASQMVYHRDPNLVYPNYWDDTDYMQHRIIGPVVLTVHESPTLEPGTYNRTPRISHWEAPGHILTEEQVQYVRSGFVRVSPSYQNTPIPDEEIFRVWPDLRWPNTGFPLPGHVMVTPQDGPGTETWEKFGMESWEEYDRSLGEKKE